MVRTPAKTCPNLFRLLNEAEPSLLSAFLQSRSFGRLDWLANYQFEPDDHEGPASAAEMLHQENKDRLNPLEAEASRIVTLMSDRGQFVLEGLARTKLEPERCRELMNQRDQLARSLWAYAREHSVFEAAENSLHLRMYRRYDKHYQTFMADPSTDGGPDAGSEILDALLSQLNTELDRGDGYSIDRFDIPEDGDEPAAEMYLLFHPDPPTSVREIDDSGNRSRIYFRPPGEAMIVYTPSTGRVHVRAGTRTLRHTIAERFIETALDQTYSNQPVDFQAYDISRFLSGFDLDSPELDDAAILRAQVIRAEISVGNLANRLSLSTTINQDISSVIGSQPGLDRIFSRAVAIRFVEIAVRYRRVDSAAEKTLNFTLTDRNTSSLLSVDDHFERVLGHKLLRHWNILQEGRAPGAAEGMTIVPALLSIWDIGTDRIAGAWLLDRGIDPALLTELGFLVPAGWEGDDLIDDEDGIGPVAADVVAQPDKVDLKVAEGHVAPSGGSPDRYRIYRVRDGWVEEHLRARLSDVLDASAIEELNKHLLYLGTLEINDRDVPIYLARSLDQEKARASVDSELRARSDLGIGLVLQAGNTAGACLAANVLTPLADHIETEEPEITLVADKLKAIFRRDQSLARGGLTVQLELTGENSGKLFVPGKGSIDISGEQRLRVVQRLVDAHNNGPAPIVTADLIAGIEDQSLSNIFGSVLWKKLKADFVRSPKRKWWEIAI